MSEIAQTDDARHIATDASNLHAGDEVIVTEEGDVVAQGTVMETEVEAGRYAITVATDERKERFWERTGRGFTKLEPPADDVESEF
jgi:ABC-type uncharacterized transport system ATPase subunit